MNSPQATVIRTLPISISEKDMLVAHILNVVKIGLRIPELTVKYERGADGENKVVFSCYRENIGRLKGTGIRNILAMARLTGTWQSENVGLEFGWAIIEPKI